MTTDRIYRKDQYNENITAYDPLGKKGRTAGRDGALTKGKA